MKSFLLYENLSGRLFWGSDKSRNVIKRNIIKLCKRDSQIKRNLLLSLLVPGVCCCIEFQLLRQLFLAQICILTRSLIL